MKRVILVDCNNFFVSCERIFNPKLLNKPVVVLSSNDACIIARSNEAKKLGIKMGEPLFKARDTIKKHNVIVHSSNFPLYADISSRVMQTLAHYSTDIEVYSVDESFLYFPNYIGTFKSIEDECAYYKLYAHMVRKKVKQEVGIPVSIGMGPTKTLAKVANHIAKKNPEYNGVCDLADHPQLDEILKKFDVADIWGVGYRYTKFLQRYGINSAYDFKNCDEKWVRKNMTVNGLRTLLELRGTPCISLQYAPDPKQSITVSRLFGRNVTELSELKEGLAFHMSTAAEKLRKQQMIAGIITVFVSFTHHYDHERFYTSSTLELPVPTAYTPSLIAHANICLEKLFKKGLIYKKVGVIIDDLQPAESLQISILSELPNITKQATIMKAIDTINAKMGRNKVFYVGAGVHKQWKTKCANRSAAYTTNWNELLTIKI